MSPNMAVSIYVGGEEDKVRIDGGIINKMEEQQNEKQNEKQNGNGGGCCNLMIWDFILVFGLTVFALSEYVSSIHVLFRIIIALAAGVAAIILMGLPFIGKIVQLVLGVFWGGLFWELLNTGCISNHKCLWALKYSDACGNGIFEHDAVWFYGIKFLFLGLFIALQFSSTAFFGVKSDEKGLILNRKLNKREMKSGFYCTISEQCRTRRIKLMKRAEKTINGGNGTQNLRALFEENNRIWKEECGKMEAAINLIEISKKRDEDAIDTFNEAYEKINNINNRLEDELNKTGNVEIEY